MRSFLTVSGLKLSPLLSHCVCTTAAAAPFSLCMDYCCPFSLCLGYCCRCSTASFSTSLASTHTIFTLPATTSGV